VNIVFSIELSNVAESFNGFDYTPPQLSCAIAGPAGAFLILVAICPVGLCIAYTYHLTLSVLTRYATTDRGTFMGSSTHACLYALEVTVLDVALQGVCALLSAHLVYFESFLGSRVHF